MKYAVKRSGMRLWWRGKNTFDAKSEIPLGLLADGKIVRMFNSKEARDRRAAAVLIEEAERVRQHARSANAPEPSDIVAQLLARAEELAHCPCKGPEEDPGPHSRCCPLSDPNYVRDEDAF